MVVSSEHVKKKKNQVELQRTLIPLLKFHRKLWRKLQLLKLQRQLQLRWQLRHSRIQRQLQLRRQLHHHQHQQDQGVLSVSIAQGEDCPRPLVRRDLAHRAKRMVQQCVLQPRPRQLVKVPLLLYR